MRFIAFLLALALALAPQRLMEGPRSPVETFSREGVCLGSLLYYESRGEPLKTQRAVLDSVFNRVVHSGLSPCEVVKQPHQFSWYGKKPMLAWSSPLEWHLTKVMGHPRMLSYSDRWFYSGAPPEWAKNMRCRKIGAMHFCKEKENGHSPS
jgi:spore germination cell wall hydrolase CwlJ-like protein